MGSVALSVGSAGLFLYLAFRNVRLDEVLAQLRQVSFFSTAGLVGLSALGLALRGWRWWYLLPRPVLWREFMPCQRALAVGYALNNVTPRLGEVVRVVMLGRAIRRPYGVIAGTVVLDRIVLDLLAGAVLFAVAMVLCRQQLIQVFAEQVASLNTLMALSGVLLLALFLFALAPRAFLRLLQLLRLDRWPRVWQPISRQVEQISSGMQVLLKPGRYAAILMQTGLIWGSYLLAFYCGLQALHVSITPGLLVATFAITTLGMLAPSPGGVGTFHFFAQASLVSLAGVEPATAAAFAAYLHGVNYVSLSAFGVVGFLWQKHSDRRTASALSSARVPVAGVSLNGPRRSD